MEEYYLAAEKMSDDTMSISSEFVSSIYLIFPPIFNKNSVYVKHRKKMYFFLKRSISKIFNSPFVNAGLYAGKMLLVNITFCHMRSKIKI